MLHVTDVLKETMNQIQNSARKKVSKNQERSRDLIVSTNIKNLKIEIWIRQTWLDFGIISELVWTQMTI